MENSDLIKKFNISKIAVAGEKIYERIKSKYGTKDVGKILAIDPESGDAYLGKNSVEAVMAAKKEHPAKVFYIVRIGFDAVYSMGSMIQKLG
jgi:hypothetical protein